MGADKRISMQVHDVGAAVLWYQDVFGARVEHQDEAGALLRSANAGVALVGRAEQASIARD